MHNLGHTRSALRRDHYLQTPDTFIRAPLPGMKAANAIVHAGPATGARFTQYTAEMEADGELGQTHLQRFLYVLEGSVRIQNESLEEGDYAYIPAGASRRVTAQPASRIVAIEKEFSGDGAMPDYFIGRASKLASQPLMGDAAVQVCMLIPDIPHFDFAVNTMTFEPGATLSLVEMHVMEHGLLMLAGGGIYRLSDSWYPVCAGDFIYMAPFCPQWFGALGKSASKYLIYKDWNRHPAS